MVHTRVMVSIALAALVSGQSLFSMQLYNAIGESAKDHPIITAAIVAAGSVWVYEKYSVQPRFAQQAQKPTAIIASASLSEADVVRIAQAQIPAPVTKEYIEAIARGVIPAPTPAPVALTEDQVKTIARELIPAQLSRKDVEEIVRGVIPAPTPAPASLTEDQVKTIVHDLLSVENIAQALAKNRKFKDAVDSRIAKIKSALDMSALAQGVVQDPHFRQVLVDTVRSALSAAPALSVTQDKDDSGAGFAELLEAGLQAAPSVLNVVVAGLERGRSRSPARH